MPIVNSQQFYEGFNGYTLNIKLDIMKQIYKTIQHSIMTATINFPKDWQGNLTGELSPGGKSIINYDKSKAYLSNLTRAKYEFLSDMIPEPLPGGR